jgi:hypothetical protein
MEFCNLSTHPQTIDPLSASLMNLSLNQTSSSPVQQSLTSSAGEDRNDWLVVNSNAAVFTEHQIMEEIICSAKTAAPYDPRERWAKESMQDGPYHAIDSYRNFFCNC